MNVAEAEKNFAMLVDKVCVEGVSVDLERMVDTNVFIRFEKSGKPIDFSAWESSQKVYISAVIVSELLMGNRP